MNKIAEILNKYAKNIPVTVREKLEAELIQNETQNNKPAKQKSDFDVAAFVEFLHLNFYYCKPNCYVDFNTRKKASLEDVKIKFLEQ
jgi:hypothetical protein